MNKYDFDFIKLDNALYDILGIVNPLDIISLKTQFCKNVNTLIDAISKKNSELIDKKNMVISKLSSDIKDVEYNISKSSFLKNSELKNKKNLLIKSLNDEQESLNKIITQFNEKKGELQTELDNISKETDIEVVLKKCITLKNNTLLSLENKIRSGDIYDEIAKKNNKRKEIFALTDLVKSVNSVTDLINERNFLLKYIERKLNFQEIRETNEYYSILNKKISIQFNMKPINFFDDYITFFEDAKIFVYNFGNVKFQFEILDDNVRKSIDKCLVGIIKRNEFNEIKFYTVLMDNYSSDIPKEFYRDIILSDIVLRNAKNNYKYLGNIVKNINDNLYGYKIDFNYDFCLKKFLEEISLSDSKDITIISNISRIKSINDALELMYDILSKSLNVKINN